MKTIFLDKPGLLRLSQTTPPEAPGAGEALVQVRRIGVCGTDLHAFRGRQPFFSYPRILGHELGVEIVEIDENGFGLKPGDRCAVEPYLNCGRCIACRRGKTNCCVNLEVLGVHSDGGMRELIKVPVHKLHKSDKLSLDQLALVETLGIGCHGVARASPEPGEWALIIGAGPIGLSVIQFAQLAGVQVIVLDVNEHRLAFCREQLQVAFCIKENPLVSLQEISGELPTLVFDATGNPESMNQAFDYVAHGGKLIFVGLFQGDITFHDPDFHRRELTLLSSRNATREDFTRIIKLLEEEKIDTTPWITHRARFENVPAEFPRWLEPESGVVKAMVEL